MRLRTLVATGLATGVTVGFLFALLRPRARSEPADPTGTPATDEPWATRSASPDHEVDAEPPEQRRVDLDLTQRAPVEANG